MTAVLATCLFLTLFILELIYFKLADRFNIIDKPNERSSHSSLTLRGGGIIFPIAALLFFLLFQFQFPYFLMGLLAISLISFLDDIHTLNNKLRIGVHLFAVLFLFLQWQLFTFPWYVCIAAAVVVIGIINAYNFMDGINGITGAYSLITIATLYYINKYILAFTSSDLLIVMGLSLIVFNFFNFRKKAKCFAGDVGSVSIAFLLTFLMGQLILQTSNLSYILLFLIYGLDTVTTIFFRILRRENIFEAHRFHFYQYLANELKWAHIPVSTLYALIQFAINVLVVFLLSESTDFTSSFATLFLIGSIAMIVFAAVRFTVEGKKHLLNIKSN